MTHNSHGAVYITQEVGGGGGDVCYTANFAKHILYTFLNSCILCIKYICKMYKFKNVYFVYIKSMLKIYI